MSLLGLMDFIIIRASDHNYKDFWFNLSAGWVYLCLFG